VKQCVRLLVAITMVLSAVWGRAQGTFRFTVTFDGEPPIAPGDALFIRYYYEEGMEFTPIGDGQFIRSGGQPHLSAFPRNGTAYLVAAFGNSLSVTSAFGARFGAVSVDLAEFSTLYPVPLTVQFVGYKPDGSTVTTAFVTDGIIDGSGPLNDFETFYFDARFADVTRVEVPTHRWSLDNMVFSNVVPEPSTGALVVVGAAILGFRLFRRK